MYESIKFFYNFPEKTTFFRKLLEIMKTSNYDTLNLEEKLGFSIGSEIETWWKHRVSPWIGILACIEDQI